MQIQSLNQPNFRGNVYILNRSGKKASQAVQSAFEKELPKLENLMQDKKYNLYISPNKNNNALYNIDANTSFNKVKEAPQGRVKIFKNAIDAVTEAAEDAINIFEEHLAYLKNREKFDIK